jgi:hypothetical protein
VIGIFTIVAPLSNNFDIPSTLTVGSVPTGHSVKIWCELFILRAPSKDAGTATLCQTSSPGTSHHEAAGAEVSSSDRKTEPLIRPKKPVKTALKMWSEKTAVDD